MKVEKISGQKEFKPVSIKLTFESKEEVRAFYLMMNYSPICEAKHVKGFIDTDAIRDSIGFVDYGSHWEEFEASIVRAVKR